MKINSMMTFPVTGVIWMELLDCIELL